MTPFTIVFLIWFSLISIVTVILYVYDKIAAKKNPRHRVREAVLLLVAALGGALAALITMLVIRHKTKHWYFIIGVPVMLVLQIVLLVGGLFLAARGSFDGVRAIIGI